jgi:hypothetical protein
MDMSIGGACWGPDRQYYALVWLCLLLGGAFVMGARRARVLIGRPSARFCTVLLYCMAGTLLSAGSWLFLDAFFNASWPRFSWRAFFFLA